MHKELILASTVIGWHDYRHSHDVSTQKPVIDSVIEYASTVWSPYIKAGNSKAAVQCLTASAGGGRQEQSISPGRMGRGEEKAGGWTSGWMDCFQVFNDNNSWYWGDAFSVHVYHQALILLVAS